MDIALETARAPAVHGVGSKTACRDRGYIGGPRKANFRAHSQT